MIYAVISLLVLLTTGFIAMLKYLRGAESNRAALSERDAELDAERQRVRQMDAAAEEARKARREKLHEEAARVRSDDDAGKLLAKVTGVDDPTLN